MPHGKKHRKGEDPRVSAAFREVYADTPSTVERTGKTGAAKREMLAAVALSKARQAGAHIPKRGGKRPHGSGVFGEQEFKQGYRRL